MAELTVQYPDDLLVAEGKPREIIEQELRFQLAVRLFEIGQLSLGKASELSGWGKIRFMDELGRQKIPIINLDQEEMELELEEIRTPDRR